MSETISVYCDESCHLEKDTINNTMVAGSVWGNFDALQESKASIKKVRSEYDLNYKYEFKWTKVSMGKLEAYKKLIDIYWSDDNLHLRAVVIPDKSLLRHEDFSQTHDDWYYKMFYTLLKFIIIKSNRYNIYLDYKDTWSYRKCQQLEKVLRTHLGDKAGLCINRVQPVKSHEVDIVQLTDVLIGAISYSFRFQPGERKGAKAILAAYLEEKSGRSLTIKSTFIEKKQNIFIWRAS